MLRQKDRQLLILLFLVCDCVAPIQGHGDHQGWAASVSQGW
jgi:hypothetical protein